MLINYLRPRLLAAVGWPTEHRLPSTVAERLWAQMRGCIVVAGLDDLYTLGRRPSASAVVVVGAGDQLPAHVRRTADWPEAWRMVSSLATAPDKVCVLTGLSSPVVKQCATAQVVSAAACTPPHGWRLVYADGLAGGGVHQAWVNDDFRPWAVREVRGGDEQ